MGVKQLTGLASSDGSLAMAVNGSLFYRKNTRKNIRTMSARERDLQQLCCRKRIIPYQPNRNEQKEKKVGLCK